MGNNCCQNQKQDILTDEKPYEIQKFFINTNQSNKNSDNAEPDTEKQVYKSPKIINNLINEYKQTSAKSKYKDPLQLRKSSTFQLNDMKSVFASKIDINQKKLSLSILESKTIAPNTSYIIGQEGLEINQRNFGCTMIGKCDTNDIIIDEKGVEAYHAEIVFDYETFAFNLKLNGCANFLVKKPQKLNNINKILFHNCRVDVFIQIFKNQNSEIESELGMVIYSNDQQNRFIFNSSRVKTVKLGKSNDCDVIVKASGISSCQCKFEYNEKENSWFIEDGINSKPSKNGTWIYVKSKEEIKLDKEVIFRIGLTRFLSNEIY